MKVKKMIAIISIVFLILLCIGCASAAQDNDTLSTESDEVQLEDAPAEEIISDENNVETTVNETETASNGTTTQTNETENTTSTVTENKITKKSVDVFCSNAFIKKSNKYFTVKVFSFNEKKNKLNYYKNVKLTVKIKIGSKTKTYNVKTNSKGVAKVLNVKNIKCGIHSVSVTSNDERYKVKEKGFLGIFSKKTKSVTLKMNKRKKIKKDYLETFYIAKNSQYPKGVYVDSYNAKKPQDVPSHYFITKAKFFFKNKKTGKIITKTVKSKANKIYGWDYPETKLISGYTPIKTQIWYAYC